MGRGGTENQGSTLLYGAVTVRRRYEGARPEEVSAPDRRMLDALIDLFESAGRRRLRVTEIRTHFSEMHLARGMSGAEARSWLLVQEKKGLVSSRRDPLNRTRLVYAPTSRAYAVVGIDGSP